MTHFVTFKKHTILVYQDPEWPEPRYKLIDIHRVLGIRQREPYTARQIPHHVSVAEVPVALSTKMTFISMAGVRYLVHRRRKRREAAKEFLEVLEDYHASRGHPVPTQSTQLALPYGEGAPEVDDPDLTSDAEVEVEIDETNPALRIFHHEVFKRARVLILEDGEPWFVLKDIADGLGYSDSANLLRYKKIDKKYLLKRAPADFTGARFSAKARHFLLINRHGILQLAKHLSPEFRAWIFEEVVPEAMKPKTAVVSTDPSSELPFRTPKTFQEFTQVLDGCMQLCRMLNRENEAGRYYLKQTLGTVEQQKQELAETRPAKEFVDQVCESMEGEMDMKAAADALCLRETTNMEDPTKPPRYVGHHLFMEALRAWGYLTKGHKKNRATRLGLEPGWMVNRPSPYFVNGTPKERSVARVTPLGLYGLARVFVKKGYVLMGGWTLKSLKDQYDELVKKQREKYNVE